MVVCRANCTRGEQGILRTFREEMTVQKVFGKYQWLMLVFHRFEPRWILLPFPPFSSQTCSAWQHSGIYTMETSLVVHVQLCSAHTQVLLPVLSVLPTLAVYFFRAFLAIPHGCSKRWWLNSEWSPPRTSEIILVLTDFLVTLSLWGRSQRGQLNHWGNDSVLACLFCCFVAQPGRLGTAPGMQWGPAFPPAVLSDCWGSKRSRDCPQGHPMTQCFNSSSVPASAWVLIFCSDQETHPKLIGGEFSSSWIK